MRNTRSFLLAAAVGILMPLAASAQTNDAVIGQDLVAPEIAPQAAPEVYSPVPTNEAAPMLGYGHSEYGHVHSDSCGCGDSGFGHSRYRGFGRGMGHSQFYNELWGGYCNEGNRERSFHRRFRSGRCHGDCQSDCNGNCDGGCDSCDSGCGERNWFSRSSLFNRSFGRRGQCDSCTSGLAMSDGGCESCGDQGCGGSMIDGCRQGMRRLSRGCNDRMRRFSSHCGRGIREFSNDCNRCVSDLANDCGRGFRRMRDDCGRMMNQCSTSLCSARPFRSFRRSGDRGGCSDCQTGDCGCSGGHYGNEIYEGQMGPGNMIPMPMDSDLPTAPRILPSPPSVDPGLVPQPEDSVNGSIYSRGEPVGFSGPSTDFPRLRQLLGQ